MRLLTIVILIAIAAVALGYLMPGQWGLLGVLAGGLLFLATALLGLLQLRDASRKR